jgi:hypothetical protein
MEKYNYNECTKLEKDFFKLLYNARNVQYDLELIIKKNKKKQDEKRKILKIIHKCIYDRELIEGGIILYRKNKLIRVVFKFLINYYIKSFTGKKISDESLENTEESFDILFDEE